MNDLQNISFDKLLKVHDKYFDVHFMGPDLSDKLACISLVCYVTNELRKKGKTVNCYEVLLMIGKDMPNDIKNTLLKSIGVICESLMYGNTIFPDFGVKPKDMPKQIRKLLDNYCPF